ncbi:cytokine-dependent hematopoietic cell linker [Hoplias malabaricus]|uniref:cytokine-dependent hematopoietic cell linker n=1 Tax=Hoplias malabaricus TaxID=27720 RepID=UPI0034618310
MERLTRGGRVRDRPDHHSDSDGDGDYHTPEEPVTHFCLSQGNQSKEYADRLPVRTWGTRRGEEEPKNVLAIPPRPPKRIGGNAAPLVNRDLKPGRQPKITSESQSKSVGSTETNTRTPPRPIKCLPRETTPQLTIPITPPKTFNHSGDSPPHRPLPSTPQRPSHNYLHTWPDGASAKGSENVNNRLVFKNDSNQRLSLDLETHDLERSGIERKNSMKDSVRRQHHEWPQVKGDADQSGYSGQSKPMEGSEELDWYVGPFSRVEAEHALHLVNREGAYLVRDCSRNTTNEPYVLAVFYENRVFNVQIRYSKETSKYTLGTRIKTNDTFDSVSDIIKFHSIFPIVLLDGRTPSTTSQPKRHCILMYPITAKDMNQLLKQQLCS